MAFERGKQNILSRIKHTKRVDQAEKRCTKLNRNGEICGQIIKPGISHKCGSTKESMRQIVDAMGPRQKEQVASHTIKEKLAEAPDVDDSGQPVLKSVRLSTFGAPLTVSKTTDAINFQEAARHTDDDIIRYWRDKNMSRQEGRDMVSFLNEDKKKKVYSYAAIEKKMNDRLPDDWFDSKLVWLETSLESGEKKWYPENNKADEDCTTCMDYVIFKSVVLLTRFLFDHNYEKSQV